MNLPNFKEIWEEKKKLKKIREASETAPRFNKAQYFIKKRNAVQKEIENNKKKFRIEEEEAEDEEKDQPTTETHIFPKDKKSKEYRSLLQTYCKFNVYVGSPGSGKTTLMLHEVKQIMSSGSCPYALVFILTPTLCNGNWDFIEILYDENDKKQVELFKLMKCEKPTVDTVRRILKFLKAHIAAGNNDKFAIFFEDSMGTYKARSDIYQELEGNHRNYHCDIYLTSQYLGMTDPALFTVATNVSSFKWDNEMQYDTAFKKFARGHVEKFGIKNARQFFEKFNEKEKYTYLRIDRSKSSADRSDFKKVNNLNQFNNFKITFDLRRKKEEEEENGQLQ